MYPAPHLANVLFEPLFQLRKVEGFGNGRRDPFRAKFAKNGLAVRWLLAQALA